MEQAIKKAIEGGWKPTKYLDYGNDKQMLGLEIFISKHAQSMALLDPLFWQALGKADGWKKLHMIDIRRGSETSQHYWLYQWHRFINHLAEGKDIDSFFNELFHD